MRCCLSLHCCLCQNILFSDMVFVTEQYVPLFLSVSLARTSSAFLDLHLGPGSPLDKLINILHSMITSLELDLH